MVCFLIILSFETSFQLPSAKTIHKNSQVARLMVLISILLFIKYKYIYFLSFCGVTLTLVIFYSSLQNQFRSEANFVKAIDEMIVFLELVE